MHTIPITERTRRRAMLPGRGRALTSAAIASLALNAGFAAPAAAQSFDELAVRLLEHPDVVAFREQAAAHR
ncbi:MAG: hypothetical protein AAGD86_02870, partial [Pseudomonadota bacterium]